MGRLSCQLIVGGLAVAFTGCGADLPTTEQASVSGSVTYDGKPVTADSTILFSCEDLGVNAGGHIDSQGNYALRAADPAVGIPVGRYRVMVHPPSPPLPIPSMDDPNYRKMMMSGGAYRAAPPPKDIPQKFTSLLTSGIVVELKPGPNTLAFDLAKLSRK